MTLNGYNIRRILKQGYDNANTQETKRFIKETIGFLRSR